MWVIEQDTVLLTVRSFNISNIKAKLKSQTATNGTGLQFTDVMLDFEVSFYQMLVAFCFLKPHFRRKEIAVSSARGVCVLWGLLAVKLLEYVIVHMQGSVGHERQGGLN